ncbi:flagellar motor protein MotB [Exiguobacterium sp. s193]|uniref:flagellar motor protein MotB n=1 Tax=Exiguobacterium sp. s193 TaxID=2751207 RepID=UPI001BEA8978|nr:flagellar motor protein MotB [Exiguobacterium sp. s193]
MKRKKKPHDEHISEGWLIPYADLLTLLLALFIVLFASSNVDAVKLKAMSQSFSSVFNGGSGMITNSSLATSQEEEDSKKTDARTKAQSYEIAELEKIKAQATDYIKKENLEKDIKVEITNEGLVFTIRDRALFSPAQAEVKGDAIQIAQGMSNLLVKSGKRQIQVSGHTDNIPIQTAKYPSNWELSAERAISFMRALQKNPQLEPKRFTVTGYGEYQPIASNQSESGRSQNRRVEVLVRPLLDIKAANLLDETTVKP